MGHKHQSQNAESYVKFLVNNFILMCLMRNCVLHFSRGIYVINTVTFDLMLTTHADIRVDIKQNLNKRQQQVTWEN